MKILQYLKSKKKIITLAASFALLLTVTVGGTLAYLMQVTEPVVNTFTITPVPNSVIEELNQDDKIKNNVRIQNDGKADAYIRAAVIVTWVDDEGNICGTKPVLGTDYTMTFPEDTDWVKGVDGYYYYTRVVPWEDEDANQNKSYDETDVLLTECKLVGGTHGVPAGYYLSVEILAQSIQADGIDSEGNRPVQLVWKDKNGTSMIKEVAEDGTLTVKTE